ncbi:MAG: hypothetical protein WCE79_02830 [Xanthobacteraceae bacterium]
MPVPPRIYTPEALADARYRYVETDEPNVSIARRLGISERTFSRNVVKWGWERRRQSARKQMAQAAPDPVAPHLPELTPEDQAAAADIEASVQHTIAAIRMIVARLPKGRSVSAAERSARTLATLTRTLQEVVRLRPKQTPPELTNDRGPANTDEFLKDLARRMDAFADARLGIGIPAAGGPVED